jgi:hypothetical protein
MTQPGGKSYFPPRFASMVSQTFAATSGPLSGYKRRHRATRWHRVEALLQDKMSMITAAGGYQSS